MQNGHKTEFDVAVIGGGSIGLVCAWRLAQGGARVVLFDRAQTGQEASFAAGGMLAPACETIVHPSADAPIGQRAMFDLCCASRDAYPAFAAELLRETGDDIELCLENSPTADWRTPGILFVAKTASDPRLGELLPHGAAQNWRDSPAIWLSSDGQVDTRKLASALREAATRSGVEIRENMTVSTLKIEYGRVIGVGDGQQTVRANQVLLCAGAWSGQISGVPPEIGAAVRPLAGQMVQLRGERRVAHVVYSDGCYLVPRRDGRLLLGATTEEVGFRKQVTAGGVAKLIHAACELVPELADAPLEGHWAGLRPVSIDGLPILGATSIAGLFVAAGHGRNGVLLAPSTGQLLSGLMLENREIAADFSPARFAGAA
jgi:glycine oxidase